MTMSPNWAGKSLQLSKILDLGLELELKPSVFYETKCDENEGYDFIF